MPGNDNFYVYNKYLKNPNYSLALGCDTYIVVFWERIVAGLTKAIQNRLVQEPHVDGCYIFFLEVP